MAVSVSFSGLDLRFLRNGTETDGSLDLFEMTVEPDAKMPIAHYHETWDETIYGLSGITTWTIAGKDVRLGPGETAFIRRGTVHGFRNDSETAATCLCILTPGVLGIEYFQEMRALLAEGSPPDLAKMKETMLRHGLVPAPNG